MRYVVLLFLLYIVDVYQFFGIRELLLAGHLGLLATGFYAFLKQFILGKSRSAVTWFIGMYCILFPMYAAYKSHIVFNQPFLTGIASLRYCCAIMFGFVLYQQNYDYKLLLKQINGINICVAAISIIAFFFWGINHITIQSFITTNNIIETQANLDTIKGAKLNVCSGLMIISYVYYLIKFLNAPTLKKNWQPFLLLMFYLCFVNKGRQPLAALAIVFAVYFIRMKGLSFKRMVIAVLPIIAVTLISMIDDQFFDKFTTVLDGEQTHDTSTMARINSINKVLPYIYDNFMLGFGNLSSRFRTFGFHTFFGHQFYIADIGVFGTLARGGIILLITYLGLYKTLYKKTVEVSDDESRIFMRYMLLTFVVMLVFLCNDTLFADNSIRIGLVFYPLFAIKAPNLFFSKNEEQNTKI